jgi:hypothetical protein
METVNVTTPLESSKELLSDMIEKIKSVYIALNVQPHPNLHYVRFHETSRRCPSINNFSRSDERCHVTFPLVVNSVSGSFSLFESRSEKDTMHQENVFGLSLVVNCLNSFDTTKKSLIIYFDYRFGSIIELCNFLIDLNLENPDQQMVHWLSSAKYYEGNVMKWKIPGLDDCEVGIALANGIDYFEHTHHVKQSFDEYGSAVVHISQTSMTHRRPDDYLLLVNEVDEEFNLMIIEHSRRLESDNQLINQLIKPFTTSLDYDIKILIDMGKIFTQVGKIFDKTFHHWNMLNSGIINSPFDFVKSNRSDLFDLFSVKPIESAEKLFWTKSIDHTLATIRRITNEPNLFTIPEHDPTDDEIVLERELDEFKESLCPQAYPFSQPLKWLYGIYVTVCKSVVGRNHAVVTHCFTRNGERRYDRRSEKSKIINIGGKYIVRVVTHDVNRIDHGDYSRFSRLPFNHVISFVTRKTDPIMTAADYPVSAFTTKADIMKYLSEDPSTNIDNVSDIDIIKCFTRNVIFCYKQNDDIGIMKTLVENHCLNLDLIMPPIMNVIGKFIANLNDSQLLNICQTINRIKSAFK